MTKMTPAGIAIGMLLAAGGLPTLVAQNAQPAGGGRGGANETWWVNKTAGGMYTLSIRTVSPRSPRRWPATRRAVRFRETGAATNLNGLWAPGAQRERLAMGSEPSPGDLTVLGSARSASTAFAAL